VTALPDGVVLAVDWGRKRVGLAVSDSSHTMAFPLKHLERSGEQAERAALKRVATENGVRSVLIGWPMHVSGEPGQNAPSIMEWVATVCLPLNLPAFFADERYSTVMAEEYLRETGRKASRRKAMIDSMAAREFLMEVLSGAARIWAFGERSPDFGLTDRNGRQ
jgi:putative Holliday junction resolvase